MLYVWYGILALLSLDRRHITYVRLSYMSTSGKYIRREIFSADVGVAMLLKRRNAQDFEPSSLESSSERKLIEIIYFAVLIAGNHCSNRRYIAFKAVLIPSLL